MKASKGGNMDSNSKHTPGPRWQTVHPDTFEIVVKQRDAAEAGLAQRDETIRGYRDSSVRDARTIANLSEQNAELLAALRRLEKAQHPVPQGEAKRTGRSHLDLCDEWNAERNAACEAARALLARVDGGGK